MITFFRPMIRSILILLICGVVLGSPVSASDKASDSGPTSNSSDPGGTIVPPGGGTINVPDFPQIVPPKFDPKPPKGQNVMARMLDGAMSATEIMAVYLNRTLLERFTWIAKWLAIGFVLASFIRTYLANPDMDFDGVVSVFLRFAICIALIPLAPGIISGFFKMGCGLAEISGAGKMQRDLRTKVDKDFDQFWTDQFLVDVTDDPSMAKVSIRKLDQRTGEVRSFVSIVSDYETKLPSISVITENASPSTWTVPEMMAFTSFSRSIVEFSNVMLTFLLFFLKVGLALVSPFMVALALDREFSQRAVKNFAWTTIFVMLFLPLITRVLGIFSYLAADLALSPVREAQHTWDPQTFHAITARGSDMAYSCGAFGIISLIASLALFASPVIAYRLSTGDAAQAFTGVAGSWMYSLAGTGVGLYSSAIGAGLTKQSEVNTANTTASVSNDQARKENKWQKEVNNANATAQHAQVAGSEKMGMAQVASGRISAIGSAEAQLGYERQASMAQYRQAQGGLATESRVGQTAFNETYNREMHPVRTAGAATGALPGLQGSNELLQRSQAGVEGLSYGRPDLTQPLGHNPMIPGKTQPYLTDSVFPSAMHARSNLLRSEYQGQVNQQYASDMTQAGVDKRGALVTTANSAAGVAAGGVHANAAAGHFSVEVVRGAQNSVADQQMAAKFGWNEQIRETAVDAANMRAWAGFFSRAGDQIAGHLREASSQYRV